MSVTEEHGYEVSTPVLTATLTKKDIVKLFQTLALKVKEAADLQVSGLQKPPGVSNEQFESHINFVKNAFDIQFTITLANGQRIFTKDINHIENTTSRIQAIYADSATTFRTRNNNSNPANFFSALIDFGRPLPLDFSISSSGQTPNSTAFTVSGLNNTWVSAVHHVIDSMFKENGNSRWWLHRANAYDFIVVIPGMAYSFYLLNKISGTLSTRFEEPFVRYAVYVYLFFLLLNVLRMLFHYGRWAWPRIELADNKDPAVQHRSFLIMGVAASLIASIMFAVFLP